MQFSRGWGETFFGKWPRIGRSSKLMMAVLALAVLVLQGAVPASATGCTPGPGAELASCDLANANLYGVNLAGADLTDANLAGANLTNANLTNANLTGVTGGSVDLQGAALTGANLTNATITSGLFDGATLQGSTITDSQFSGSDFTGLISGGVIGTPSILPTNWSLAGGYLLGPTANLTNDDLSGVNVANADLAGAYLTGANLSGTGLGSANLSGLITGGVTGTPSTLPSNWSLANGYLIGPSAFLYGANLTGADLSGADASGGNFEGANLTNANLTGANLTNIDGINSTFTGADLGSTSLSGSDLDDVVSGGITGVAASLPSSWQLASGYLVGPYSNLVNANLTDAALIKSDLYKADMNGANLTGADLLSSNLSIAVLVGANLTKASLTKADLVGASLNGANVSGTVFTSANLSGVSSGGLVGKPGPLPSGWRLDGGYLVGPYANLVGANLQKAKLSNIDLQGANATGANLKSSTLTGANLASATLSQAALTGVVSGGITGKPKSLPAGWELVKGVLRLIPPKAKSVAKPAIAKAEVASTSKAGSASGAAVAKSTTTPQYGIDVYAPDSCVPASTWQSEATNTMQGFKSLGANSVGITFPIFTADANSNSVFAADLCNEPSATPVPLQTPSPARLAVLIHAAQVAGLHVLLRPEIQESNLYFTGHWRGTIGPTNKTAWFQSYQSVLKPYFQMSQANGVTRFDISVELASLQGQTTLWKSTITAAKQLYKGQLIFDSSWEAGGGVTYWAPRQQRTRIPM